MKYFGSEIVGKCFRVNGVVFQILELTAFPKEKVSDRYKAILAFKPWLLVALKYRATLIPNITLKDGVVRLTKVEVDGKVIGTPLAISRALGIKKDMIPYKLNTAGN